MIDSSKGSSPGYALGAVGRPYVTVTADRGQMALRLARVGPEVLELTAEYVGLEALDGCQVSLRVDGSSVDGVLGTLRDVGVGRAFFTFTTPDPAVGRELMQIASTFPQMHTQLSVPPPSEHLAAPGFVRSVLRALLVNDTHATIAGAGADWRLRPAQLEEDSITWIVLEKGGAPCSPLVIEASGYSASYELHVLIIDEHEGVLRTTVPQSLARIRRRRMPRAAAKGALTARFVHPTYRTPIERPILNVSEEGFAIESALEDDLLCPELPLDEVTILRGDVALAHFPAIVRTVNLARNQVGLRVLPRDTATLRAWGEVVRALLHGRTRSAGYSADELWDLYLSAGYLSLAGKTPEDFAALKSAFSHATERLLQHPEIGHHFVWPAEPSVEGGALDAAVTNVLAFSTAYFGYQMAKRPGKWVRGAVGKQMLRDIHWHALEEALSNPSCEWCVICVQATTRFSNLLFVDFPARFRNPELEAVVAFRPYQITCDEPLDPARVQDALATPEELVALCNVIQVTRPSPYWRCQDLSVERIDLAEPKARWAQAGLERDRAVLVLREHGQAKAAMVLDVGQPGVHLFGFFDVAHFYPLDGTGERLLEPMLALAKAWYRQRGRRSFMYFHEGTHELAAAADRVDLGSASYCIISVHLIPDLLDYLFENMSWDPSESTPPPQLNA